MQQQLLAELGPGKRSFAPWRRLHHEEPAIPPETCAELERLALSTMSRLSARRSGSA
jgi:hypothetical protein